MATLFEDPKFWIKLYEYCRENGIDPDNIVWEPDFSDGCCNIAVFVDNDSGWPHVVEENGDIHKDGCSMDFNMYVKECWSCRKEIEKPRHVNRCFFCKECCKVKEHPNPHV